MVTTAISNDWITGPSSAPSFWEPFHAQERCRHITPATPSKPTPRPAARPDPKPEPRPEPRRTSTPPAKAKSSPFTVTVDDFLSGVACVMGEWMKPAYRNPDFAGYEMVYATGALDDSLTAIRRGDAVASLLIGHDERQKLATTRDGLRLWRDGENLRFKITGATVEGRIAIMTARMNPNLEKVSLGSSETKYLHGRSERRMVVTEAEIIEISLVPRGACPGTYVFLT